MDRLESSLLEMLVVAGMDEQTGLVASNPQPPAVFHHENKLFSLAFEPQILAAISGHVATFPTSTNPKDPNYPPAATRVTSNTKADRLTAGSIYKTWAVPKLKPRTPVAQRKYTRQHSGSLQRNKSRTASFRMFDFAQKRASTDNLLLSPTELPLGAEGLQSLMSFCYPDGAYVKAVLEPPSVHYQVLTDIEGRRSYTVCVTTYLPHTTQQIQEGDQERWKLEKLGPGKPGPGKSQGAVYVPVCFVAVTKIPYFSVLKHCLSCLAKRLETVHEEWSFILKEFTLHLCRTVTPPAGRMLLDFELFSDCHILVHGPAHKDQDVVDFSLSLPFLHLGVDNVLTVLSAILCQQRVVFVSAHQAALVLVCQAFQHMIYPFKWIYTYVPLLSWNLVELVEAPGSFIMGCHARHRHFLDEVPGLVLVDIDFGDVIVCDTVTFPSIPSSAAHIFSLAIRQARRHSDWFGLGRTTSFSREDGGRQEHQRQQEINKIIQTACLELMANLFRDVFSNSNREKRFFHRDQFLQCMGEEDKAFYEKVLQTDIFGDFITEQLSSNKKRSYWSEFLERTKPYNRNSLCILNSGSPTKSPLRTSQSLSMISTNHSEVLGDHAEPAVIHFPPFIFALSHAYIDNCLLELDNASKSCVTLETKGALAFMRGMLLSCQRKKKQALEAFYEVESCDARIFPTSCVSEILSSLSPEDKEIVRSSFLYNKSALFKEAAELSSNGLSVRQPVIMELSKLPQADIDGHGFSELVQLLFDPSPDMDTISRLFDALTLGERTAVDPYTFEEFYHCWKENEVSCRQITLPSTILETNESLLLVSDMCKCTWGTGRIALTQKRILFLHEGSKKCREVIHLRIIKSLEIIQQRSLLKPVFALKITHADERVKPFVACLKEVCEDWMLLVGEMWSGKLLAEETRNPAIVDKAAQNVLFAYAFIQSGQAECTNHHGYEMEEAESLCYYRHRKLQGDTDLPPDTREFLQQQLDPSGHESERSGVEALLYTPGRLVGSPTEDYGPRLWCGMTSGKIVVYDAVNWGLEAQLALSGDKLTCLMSVNERQVWVGCADSNIYILNQRTKSCNQTLTDHRDSITGFSPSDNASVYSCSIDGQILRWNTKTLRVSAETKLPGHPSLLGVHYHNQRLWCCTHDEVILLSSNGNLLQKISLQARAGIPTQLSTGVPTLPSPDVPAHLSCFLLTPQNELWLGLSREGEIVVFYADSLEEKQRITLPCRGISNIILVSNKVWAGSRDGQLYVCDSLNNSLELTLYAHGDCVHGLCTAQERYIISGSGVLDGKVSIWRIMSGLLL